MCKAEKASKCAKEKPDAKPSATQACPVVKKIKVLKVEVVVDAPSDKQVMMNKLDTKVLATATMTYRDDSTDTEDLDKLPKIRFTYTDPGNNNTKHNKSYKYDGTNRLGKRDNTAAVFWEAHPESAATSSDSFNTMAKADAKPQPGSGETKTAVAKIWFKPSGVGGDNFTIDASVYKPDGTTKICDASSSEIEVWREINFNNIYTMDSESYIDAATKDAEINPAFKPKAYVEYTQGTVTKLASSLDVKYIGLYKSGGGSLVWPTDFSPAKLESTPNQLAPTATELSDYKGTNSAKKAAAKTKIEAKAQLWFSAIITAYRKSLDAWFTDAGISTASNTLLAVKYYHPKLSGQSDGATTFWPAGIQINVANPGSGLTNNKHPDDTTWREVQGFNRGKIVVIFKNYGTAARLKIICRHEIGHATKSEFERDLFGTGDHSSSKLMTPYGSASTFSAADIKILRGIA
ncbi:hypothetical protein PN836_014960 [Ningiella sp. W23]|uniref:hypothetical protein n=1 Tax=Ningiella sp. W23 TaxID=3023715 RepID=UPI003757EACE